jgi:hypothetical protein
MNNLKFIFLTIVVSLFVIGCSDLEEINTNPDKSTTATPDMLASYTMMKTFKLANSSPDVYVQITVFDHHVTKLSSSAEPGQYYWSYYPYGSYGNYKYLTDLQDMVTFAEGSIAEPSYRGLALFFKAWYGYQATLDMGDVPYSEAGMGREGITQPVYDPQSEVFASILADLKQAEIYFAEGINFSGDIMYGGNASKWRKLCNALQLQVLQTMSKKATATEKARFAEIVNTGNLMTGYADDLKLVYTTNTNASYPFYNANNQRLDQAASSLTVNALKNLNDYRLFYFADPAAQMLGTYPESSFNAYVGAPYEIASNTLSINGDAGMYSLVNNRYTLYKDNDPLLFFTYAEQCFIIAEAIEEGWLSGNAQTYYENGVKAQLSYYMNLPHTSGHVHGMPITQTYINNYFTGEAAYKTGGTKQDRLEQIWIQRWLIDYFQPNSAYYHQFLRTGFPEYVLNPATSLNEDNQNAFPKRWRYPANEISTNPGNYQSAIDSQYGGVDNTMQVPWYLQ